MATQKKMAVIVRHECGNKMQITFVGKIVAVGCPCGKGDMEIESVFDPDPR